MLATCGAFLASSPPWKSTADASLTPHSPEDYAAFAVEAVRDAEHADGSDVWLEFLARAQAYALIAIAALLAESLRDLADRRSGR